jgi:hypothetical protein
MTAASVRSIERLDCLYTGIDERPTDRAPARANAYMELIAASP